MRCDVCGYTVEWMGAAVASKGGKGKKPRSDAPRRTYVGSSADPIGDSIPVPSEYRNITLRHRERSENRAATADGAAAKPRKSGWWGRKSAGDAAGAAGASRVASAGMGDAARWNMRKKSGASAAGAGARKSDSLPFRNPSVDPALREHMREWRRNTAREQGLPAFVVLNDASLDELCRVSPKTLTELLGSEWVWGEEDGGVRKADYCGVGGV